MVNIHALIKALPRYGLEPREIALIKDIPEPGGYDLWFYEPPSAWREPFIDVVSVMTQALRCEGIEYAEASKRARREYAALRESLDVFSRPVLYDAGRDADDECVPASIGIPFLLEKGIIDKEVSQFLINAVEVISNAALFDDPDDWRIRHKLTELPDVPSPKQLVEFVPWGPWTDGPDRDTGAWLAWREKIRPIAESLKEKLGEEVYYFADLDDDLDDDFGHRFFVLHWLCVHRPESPYVKYLIDVSEAADIEELKSALLAEKSYIHPHIFSAIEAEVHFPRITYHPPRKHRVGVVFSTEDALATAKLIISCQIGSCVSLAAPVELLYDTSVKEYMRKYGLLKDSMRFSHRYGERYLENGKLDEPIEFLSNIDELYVVEDARVDNYNTGLNITESIENLLWLAISFGITTRYFTSNGSELVNPAASLEKDGTPERVLRGQQQRKLFTESLSEIRVDTD